MRDGWFNRFLGKIEDDEIYDELVNYEPQDDDDEFYSKLIKNKEKNPIDWGFDDTWLIKDFVEEIFENKDILSQKKLGLISFEGDLYLPFEGTQHHMNLNYIMQHSN